MAFFNYVNPWPETTHWPLRSPLLSAGRRDAAVWTRTSRPRLRTSVRKFRVAPRASYSYVICAPRPTAGALSYRPKRLAQNAFLVRYGPVLYDRDLTVSCVLCSLLAPLPLPLPAARCSGRGKGKGVGFLAWNRPPGPGSRASGGGAGAARGASSRSGLRSAGHRSEPEAGAGARCARGNALSVATRHHAAPMSASRSHSPLPTAHRRRLRASRRGVLML
jgi:hypothetical protein